MVEVYQGPKKIVLVVTPRWYGDAVADLEKQEGELEKGVGKGPVRLKVMETPRGYIIAGQELMRK
ncbi:MAG: hypothetical protein ABIH37_03385 [archaeon]